MVKANSVLDNSDAFVNRHIGPRQSDIELMLEELGLDSLEELVSLSAPNAIRMKRPLQLDAAMSEQAILDDLRSMAAKNEVYRSYIGMGYYGCVTPSVIQRNVLENPAWYTHYTPYQPEIAQGRLEALLNFQTMVADLTGLEIANASMLDEGTAAAEAMTMSKRAVHSNGNRFFVSDKCHPQTIAVVQTRAGALGIELVVGDHSEVVFDETYFGALAQYPDTEGSIHDYADLAQRIHDVGGMFIIATDLLALTLLTPPGEFGADIAVGSSQRFGLPMAYGGPHAAFMATKTEYQRNLPGRLVGVSVDADGNPALRLALQTREQHIRRDKATSNICTAQVLLAIMASMYAVYHGPKGLKRIAVRVAAKTATLAEKLQQMGYTINTSPVFDTLKIASGPFSQSELIKRAQRERINLRTFADGAVGVSLDEATTWDEVATLLSVFGINGNAALPEEQVTWEPDYPTYCSRTSDYMTHPVFNSYRSETEMLRYIFQLQQKDLSLAQSMIPLGSCTMKLNSTTSMLPLSWPEFANMHPFAPLEQTQGYAELIDRLSAELAEITGFAAVSLQPNVGSQGEYTGLLTIAAYHRDRGDSHRDICLIPSSAHGTNPASAVMAGMRVVVVACDERGDIDTADLRKKAEAHRDKLAALMVTYPSTHGVFEEGIVEVCDIVHANGGLVYMDGANMNALVGLGRPGDIGADVCHLNLHKTFAIPHGGGGPGVGPIGVAMHLVDYLPNSPVVSSVGGGKSVGAIASAPWGSASILSISYAYIRMMGPAGLRMATDIAILNANYIASRLQPYYPVLFRGENGFVAHECITDARQFKKFGVEVDDIAKRLMDYGFHAPTMSFPVAGTLMIEPTESESKEELDRFCAAMISIRQEIQAIEDGQVTAEESVLRGSPHTAITVTRDEWGRAYTREKAAYPAPWLTVSKYWPPVSRVDNVYGDRHLVCTCEPIETYAESMTEFVV